MREKCTGLITTSYLILLSIVSLSNTQRNQISAQKYDGCKKTISHILYRVIKLANFGDNLETSNQDICIEPVKFHELVILRPAVTTYSWCLNKQRYISTRKYFDFNKEHKLTAPKDEFYLEYKHKSAKFPRKLVIFMVAITFVKFVIIVIAVQLLLHNAFMIITNFYHNYIKQLESAICNQSYQLISGHGLGDEGKFLQKPYQHQQKVFQQVNKLIECILANANTDYFRKEKFSSINKKYELSLSALNTYKQKLYHQQELNYNSFYHQFYYINNIYRCNKHQHRDYHQHYYNCISYVKDQGYFHPVEEKPIHFLYNIIHCDNSLVSPILRQIFSSWKKPNAGTHITNTKLMRACYSCFRDCLTCQPTTPFIPLASLSSTVCCWKTTGNHKRRKRKNNLIWDKYVRNCNYLIRKRSLRYNCCSSEIVCIFCFRYSECLHNDFYYYWIFITDSKASFGQTTLWTSSFCKQKITKDNALHKNRTHPINIIQLSNNVMKFSRHITRDWCIHRNHYDESENNLLGSISTVKAIPPVFQNLNYKRMFKNNLVWLFIGLVWLEGPKLINCNISHTNNDITNINGNETTNKFGSSHSSNNDSSSDNNGSTGGNNSSTNEPDPSPRQEASDSNRHNIKSSNILKIYNLKQNSESTSTKGDNNLKQNVISIYQPVNINKQNIFETYHLQNRTQHQKPYTISRNGHKLDQPTNSRMSSVSEKNDPKQRFEIYQLSSYPFEDHERPYSASSQAITLPAAELLHLLYANTC